VHYLLVTNLDLGDVRMAPHALRRALPSRELIELHKIELAIAPAALSIDTQS
jgi:hypothetical protein